MVYLISHCFAASRQTRPSTRPAQGLALALRVIVLALLAGFGALLAHRAGAAPDPTVYSFLGGTTDGQYPEAQPVEDSQGNLWGTTFAGGSSGLGTVWEITARASVTSATPVKETIISFSGTTGNTTASSGGAVIGANPIGGLDVGIDGSLYGTTYAGGANGKGEFFQVNPTTGVITVLYSIAASGDPSNPSATPVQDPNNGYFYFPCYQGGTYSVGGTLAISNAGVKEYSYSFERSAKTSATNDYDPEFPVGQVAVVKISSSYYVFGTAAREFVYPSTTTNKGTIYILPDNFSSSTQSYTVFSLLPGTAEFSTSGLIADASGNLYGSTANGGTNSTGKLFKFVPSVPTSAGSGTVTTLYSLPTGGPTAALTAFPEGALALNTISGNTYLFGATAAGGGTGYTGSSGSNDYGGDIFSYNLTTPGISNIYAFTNTALADSKNFYSTTITSSGYYNPTLNNFTTSGIYYGPDGYYYGTGYEGGTASSYGTVYKFGPPWTYNYTYFTTPSTAVNLNLAINDYVSGIADNYTLASPTAPTHGTISTPLTGSVTSTASATAPTLTNTYTPNSGFTGLDTFTYTATNPFGTSLTGSKAYGNVSVYVGTLTASGTSPVTGTTATLTAGGTLTTSSDTTLIYTWATSGTPPAAVAFSAANGTHSAGTTAVTATFTKAGTYTFVLTATAPDGTVLTATPATVSVTVNTTVGAFTVSPSSATIGNGGTQQYTASPTDQFGNAVTPTWSVSGPVGTTISATGLLTAGSTSGTGTVTATAGGTTATASVTVTVPTFTVNTPTATSSGAVVTLNETASVTPTATITYAWSLVSGAGTVTAWTNQTSATATATVSAPGLYTFQVIVSTAGFSSVTKTVQVTLTSTPTTITISPTTVTVYPGGPAQTFTAVVKDQFGNTLTGQTPTWGVGGAAAGSITTGGIYSVAANKGTGSTQTDTVKASIGSVMSNTATVTVAEGTVSFTTAAFATPSTVTGTTTVLSATATWTGGASYVSYQWFHDTLQGSTTPVKFSDGTTDVSNLTVGGNTLTATFTKAGTYYFYVAAVSPDGYAYTYSPLTTDIAVTVVQTLSGLSITPVTGSIINPSSVTSLKATSVDQFGNAITALPSVTWSIVSGGGSLSSTTTNPTNFTAPAANGSVTVKAVSGSYSATATYSVQASPPVITQVAEAAGFPYQYDDAGYGTGTVNDPYGDTEAYLYATATYNGTESYLWTYTGPTGVTFDSTYTAATYDPTVYFTQAGTYVFTCKVTGADGLSVTTSVTLIIQPLASNISIAPSGTIYLGKGTTQQFTGTELDQFGNNISPTSLVWNAFDNPISASGLYSANTTISYDDVYAYDSDPNSFATSNFVNIYVVNPAPTVATEIAGTVSTGLHTATTTTTTSNLSVLGQWLSGTHNLGESNLTYTWSTFGTQPGTVNFSVNGTNAAKNTVATFGAAGTYYIYVTITSAGAKSVQDPPSGTYLVVTVSQTLASVKISPTTATLGLGTTQNFNATGYDQFGSLMSTQPTFTWTTSFSSPSSVNSTGQFSANTPGTGTVTATSGSLSATATVTVNDAAPTLTAITLDPTQTAPYTITGTSTGLVVTGNYAGPGSLTYTWSKVSGPGTVSFSGGTTSTPGLAVETTALFGASGTYVIQVVATDSQGLSSSPATVTITVAPTFSAVKCTPNPVTVPIGSTQQFTAVAYDQFGIALPTQPTFTWSVVNSGGAASTISASGLLTAGSAPGSAVVKAASGAFSDTSAVTISDAAPTLSAITSNHNPLTGTAATFTVTGTYAGSGTLTYAWSATGPSNVVFAGGTSGTSGTAVTTTGTFNAIGTYTVTVIVTDASGQSATQTYTETVSPAESKILTNLPLSVAINGTVTATATAYDQFGVALSSQPSFSWSVTAGAASGSIAASTGVFTATGTAGTATISVTGSTVTTTGTITVINQPPTVATAASANPNPVTTGKTTTLSVLGAYAGTGGEGALTYTWSAVAGPATPSFSVNGSNAAKSSVCTFVKAGTYDLRVTITDAAGGTTSSDVTVVVNQTLTTIVVTPGPTDTETIGTGTQTYVATGYGQFGNPMAVPPTFTWSNTGVGSVNSSTGVYTITVPGTATITATSGGVSGQTVVTINDVAPTVGTAASATPNPVGGTTTALSVLGQYTNSESGLTYTWASSPSTGVSFTANGTNAAKNTTATFTAAGTYTFTVTIADGYGGTVTSSVIVTVVQSATTITVTPNPASVAINGTQQFTATVTDQFGTAISSPTFTWSVKNGYGTITAGGLYTAGTVPNTETVEAAYGGATGDATGDATVTVTDVNPTLGAITITPNPVTGTTATFSATGTYAGSGALTYVWSTVGTPPAPVTFSGGTSGASGSSVTATGTFTRSGSYTVRVTVSDQYGAFATETLVFTVNQTPTTLVVSPTPVSVTDGTTQQFTATVADQFGDPLATQPTFTWSVSSGSGTVNSSGLYTAPTLPGSSTVKVTGDGLTATASVTNTDAPPTVATAASASPNPVTTGTTTSLSVLGAYIDGESDLTYTWAAPMGSGITFSVNGTNAAKNTVATFTAAGTYVLSVTISDPSGNTASSSVSVMVDAANGPVVISPSPASTSVGSTLQLYVVQNDQFGNVLSPQPTFTWSVMSGGGSVSTNGLFTAPLTTGTTVVKATSSFGGSATVTITTTDVAPTIATAASASPNPVAVQATTLSVTAAYAGDPATLTYTWSYAGPTGVTYSGTANGTNGGSTLQANFTQAGTYVFTVTVANTTGQSVTSSVTVTVNQTLTNVVVTPSTASINIGTTQQFTATAYDQFGIALATQPAFTWTVPVGTGTVSTNGLYAATLAPGSATVKATAGSFSDTAAVTVVDTPVTVATAASATPNPVTGTSTTLSVLGAWGGGESNLTYTWALTSGPASVTFSANVSNAAKTTTASFSKAGSYAFTVTITDGYGGSATSSVTVTVNVTATTFVISPTSAAVNVGGTKQFTATAYDQFGVLLSPQPTLTWSIASGPGSVSSSGLYTASTTTGTAIVQVTGGTQSATAAVTVSDVAPTVATAASASPNPVTGTTTNLSVLGAYAGGESNLTYTWSATGPAAVTYSANGTNAAKMSTATFTQAGTYTFTVTIATPSGLTVTSTVTVTVKQTSTTFTVSPVTSTLVVNGGEQLSATVLDQFGNAVNPQPTVTWTIMSGGGTVGANGLFNAPNSAGTTVVKATAGTYSATLTITIDDGPPTIATAASATPNPVTAKTTALSVLGAYIGGESNLTYTWSATGPAAVTYSVNGTNAAKNTTATFTKAGTYAFTVTVATPSGYTTTSSVTVTVNQTPTSVTVTPNPGSVGTSGTLQMSAASLDQFGSAISPAPAFTWAVASGGGSISSSGLYTAPATTGTATVKATAGTATGTATVNIVAVGTISGTVSMSNAAVNLTTQGTLDWNHWGRGAPGLDQKSGGNLLSGYTLLGSAAASSYRTDPRLLSWTNGTPTASSTSNATGVDVGGIGNGFQVMSPAIGTTRTVVVYVGGINAGGTLTAKLSDGSVAPYVNTIATTSGQWDAEYTITYASGSGSGSLVVSWVEASGTGAVTLSAVTLH